MSELYETIYRSREQRIRDLETAIEDITREINALKALNKFTEIELWAQKDGAWWAAHKKDLQ